MRSPFYDWEYLIWMLVYAAPTLIVWCFAIYFCFARRQENPKGAMFLGLAILVQFANSAFSYLLPYLMMTYSSSGSTAGMGMMSYFGYGIMGLNIGANALMWIFITMAVFARPMHYDYSAGPMFDNEQV